MTTNGSTVGWLVIGKSRHHHIFGVDFNAPDCRLQCAIWIVTSARTLGRLCKARPLCLLQLRKWALSGSYPPTESERCRTMRCLGQVPSEKHWRTSATTLFGKLSGWSTTCCVTGSSPSRTLYSRLEQFKGRRHLCCWVFHLLAMQ